MLPQLRAEGALAVALVVANVAFAQFAEPLLLGRVVDKLAAAQGSPHLPQWGDLAPLLAAWGGSGCSRSWRASPSRSETHSGRLTKIMLDGPNAMFGLWLTFFREHCAAFVALFVTPPATLVVNSAFGLVLIGLVFVFGLAMNLVIRATGRRQGFADGRYHAMAAHVADALVNLPTLQAFARTKVEAQAYRASGKAYLAAQFPVLAWWAVATVATRASATLTLIGVLTFGVWLFLQGRTTVGEIVGFMGLAARLVARLDQVNGFLFRIFGAAGDLDAYFAARAVRPAAARRPCALRARRQCLWGPRRADRRQFRRPRRAHGGAGSGKSTALALLHRAINPRQCRVLLDGIDLRDMTLASLRANVAVVLQEPYLLARTVAENLRIGKPDATGAEIARALDQAQADFVRALPQGLASEVGERGRNFSRGESARASPSRALCSRMRRC